MQFPLLEGFAPNGVGGNSTRQVFMGHELPVYMFRFDGRMTDIAAIEEETREVESIEQEIGRMLDFFGKPLLEASYGENYKDAIEEAINSIMEKEKAKNGSKNTAQSKNGTSSKIRV
jgi:hypothetical protein